MYGAPREDSEFYKYGANLDLLTGVPVAGALWLIYQCAGCLCWLALTTVKLMRGGVEELVNNLHMSQLTNVRFTATPAL